MSTPFLGEIKMFGGNFAPRGYAMCSGQLLSIAQNTALFALLGTTYGGDGQVTFGLPDLRGRLPIHQGQRSGGSPYTLGQTGGSESVTLVTTQLPAHGHALMASTNAVNDSTPTSSLALGQQTSGELYAAPAGGADVSLHASSLSLSGGSQPHSNLQPLLCVTFIIALEGIFPSRN